MGSRVLTPGFWRGKRVLITGHTGFKGSWLSIWLHHLGARVIGFGLEPPSQPSLYEQAHVHELLEEKRGDVVDRSRVEEAISEAEPDIVFHLAAQSLVRLSFQDPLGTYRTNVVGTANLLEGLRHIPTVRVAVVITSDKCYENRGDGRSYREDDRLGGADPYSNSKACAELVTSAFRTSFFTGETDARIATARAGNVIGSCDWSLDRLVPDLVRAAQLGTRARIRYPDAKRPWQHVLDCLAGYLCLAEGLWEDPTLVGAWNFGPDPEDVRSVRWIADTLVERWPQHAGWELDRGSHPPEAPVLRLDATKAQIGLGWEPRLSLEEALAMTLEGYLASGDPGHLRGVLEAQLMRYREARQGAHT